MAKWYLRTRPRRGRVNIVGAEGMTVDIEPRVPGRPDDMQPSERKRVTVHWAATRDDAKFFPTRAEAIAFRDMVHTATGWARKWVPVNADKATRPAADFKPRQNVAPTVEESARLSLAVASAREHASAAGLSLPAFGVYVTERKRSCRGGRHRSGQYYIAIDRWAFASDADKKPGYLTYIVAHELAHVADVFHTGRTSHGPQFMAHLRKLCPLKLQAYELAYKPTAARAAGIRLSDAAPEVQACVRPARAVPPNILEIIERAKAAMLAAEGKV